MEIFSGPAQEPSPSNVALFNAAKNGDVTALKQALENGTNQ